MNTDNTVRQELRLGKWTRESLDIFLRRSSAIGSLACRIESISRQFLGLPYQSTTLVGSPDIPEALVINLENVDCFTYLDYVEAMRLSHSFQGFVENLKEVRYKSGIVSYEARRHFFSDWMESKHIDEITGEIGKQSTKCVVKKLNRKSDGSGFLPALLFEDRAIRFVPTPLDPAAADRLQTADYVGLYTEEDGLDASHVGIVISSLDGLLIRHASSLKGRVLEEDLAAYVDPKPGIIVLRPTAHAPRP